MTLTAFLTVAVLSLFIAICPGPAVLMSARTNMALAYGIALGAVSWTMAAMFGFSLLFEHAPFALTAIKLVGASYLFYMAWRMWRDAAQPLDAGVEARTPRTVGSAFRLGLFTQYSNPKAAVMFSSLFVGTVPPGINCAVIAALMLVIFLNEAIWSTFVARISSLDGPRRTYLGLKTRIDRSFGGMLALLGLKIAIQG